MPKRILAVAFIACATGAFAEIVQPDPGQSDEAIIKCLKDLGMEQGHHFRISPKNSKRVQIHQGNVQDDIKDYLSGKVNWEEIKDCWKRPENRKKK